MMTPEAWEREHSRARPPDRPTPGWAALPFAAILERHLVPGGERTALEIGCVPGRALAWFALRLGYRVSGLDRSPAVAAVAPRLAALGIEPVEVFQADLFEFAPARRWDVVYSGGFLEHFADPRPAFERHLALLAPGGTLVVSVPNLRGFPGLVRRLFAGPDFLASHNIDVMTPRVWRDLALSAGLDIRYCDYVGTIRLWLPSEANALARLVVVGSSRALERGLRLLRLEQIPNRWFSPHVLLVARSHADA